MTHATCAEIWNKSLRRTLRRTRLYRYKFDNHNYAYFGEKLSSDLCGPFPKSIEGYRYLLNVVDAYTSELWIHPLRTKLSLPSTTLPVLRKPGNRGEGSCARCTYNWRLFAHLS